MSRRPVSNPLALAVLACLWERPMYPYEITTTLRERGKDQSIRLNFGSLYAVIKSLQKHGLIAEARSEREGNRPERIVYEITEAGRTEAHDWMRDIIAEPAREHPALEAGLSLIALLPPDEAIDLLHHRVGRLDAMVKELERQIADTTAAIVVPEIFLVEGRFHIAMLKAERDWVDDLARRLDRGEVEGQDFWARAHAVLADGISQDEFTAALAAEEVGKPRQH